MGNDSEGDESIEEESFANSGIMQSGMDYER